MTLPAGTVTLLFSDIEGSTRLLRRLADGSMDAVLRQLPDVPYDSEAPLYPFGHGLSY